MSAPISFSINNVIIPGVQKLSGQILAVPGCIITLAATLTVAAVAKVALAVIALLAGVFCGIYIYLRLELRIKASRLKTAAERFLNSLLEIQKARDRILEMNPSDQKEIILNYRSQVENGIIEFERLERSSKSFLNSIQPIQTQDEMTKIRKELDEILTQLNSLLQSHTATSDASNDNSPEHQA